MRSLGHWLHVGVFSSSQRYELILSWIYALTGLPGGSVIKNPPASAGLRFSPWVGKIPWRRKWQPALVFSPGKSHGERSVAGDSPWGRKRVRHDLVTKQRVRPHHSCILHRITPRTRIEAISTSVPRLPHVNLWKAFPKRSLPSAPCMAFILRL